MAAPYPLISSYNMSKGVHILFVYVNDITGGLFMSLVLFAIYMVFLTGIFFTQKASQGYGSIGAAMFIAGLVTAVSGGFLALVTGLINSSVIIITFVAAIVGTIVLFFLDNG
jgi:hypothetical protein